MLLWRERQKKERKENEKYVKYFPPAEASCARSAPLSSRRNSGEARVVAVGSDSFFL